jgi:mycothiol system anti-sigma-R factor
MADCNETLHELFTFLDGELPDGARHEVVVHLETCPDCLQAFDFHAELKTTIARKCRTDEMPAGLLDKIQACFGSELLDDPAD